jgi:hypothetical protein
MEIPAMRGEERKEDQPNRSTEGVIAQNASVAGSAHRATGERAKLASKDPHAARKLARKKKLKTAHRRRLKASHAKG